MESEGSEPSGKDGGEVVVEGDMGANCSDVVHMSTEYAIGE